MHNLTFYALGVVDSSLMSRFSSYTDNTCFTIDIDTFVPISFSIFIRSFAGFCNWFEHFGQKHIQLLETKMQ